MRTFRSGFAIFVAVHRPTGATTSYRPISDTVGYLMLAASSYFLVPDADFVNKALLLYANQMRSNGHIYKY